MGWEHVVPQFIVRAHELDKITQAGRLKFNIQGDGSNTRAFCFIDDFTEGAALAFQKGGHREIYLVGTNDEVSITQVAEKVVALVGRDAEIICGDEPAGQTSRRCPDISKVSALGYQPKVVLDTGLRLTTDWYRKNIDLKDANLVALS
jgi:UDP-glucose 4-epimerase